MNYHEILNTIEQEVSQKTHTGEVASYIPELAKVSASKFGMHLLCIKSGHYGFGDHIEQFSIQSISKVFALTLVMKLVDDKDLFTRVDVEPSGDPFNSFCLLYTSPSPRDGATSRMPSSA